MQIYNPYAVIKYLNECVDLKAIVDGKPYWTETGSLVLIKKIC